MKVGTDGTLLGAWARGGDTILDIGTGTGLIAMMMAQRFPDARIIGIDIDHDAVLQARENVAVSPFGNISIVEGDVRTFFNILTNPSQELGTLFSTIVANPPFFVESLECPDNRRTVARHASSLSYRDMMATAWRLLNDDGELSVIIPADCKSRMDTEATFAGFSKSRECAIKTTPKKAPRRFLLAFRKHPVSVVESETGIIEDAPNLRSAWYSELTKDFYL